MQRPIEFNKSDEVNIAHIQIYKDSDDLKIMSNMSDRAKIEIIEDPEEIVLMARIFKCKDKIKIFERLADPSNRTLFVHFRIEIFTCS